MYRVVGQSSGFYQALVQAQYTECDWAKKFTF